MVGGLEGREMSALVDHLPHTHARACMPFTHSLTHSMMCDRQSVEFLFRTNKARFAYPAWLQLLSDVARNVKPAAVAVHKPSKGGESIHLCVYIDRYRTRDQ